MNKTALENNWRNEKLGKVATFYNGRAYQLSEWETEGTPVIRLQNLTGSGSEYYYSTLTLPDKQYVNKGELLYMWSGSFGPVIWWGDKAIYHYHIWRIECSEELNQKYLYFQLDYITESLKGKSHGGLGLLHITKEGIEATEVPLPPVKEQQKIAKILTTVDNLIEKTEALIEKYQAIKQGMMHDLFTRGIDTNGQLRPSHHDAPHLYKQTELGWIPMEWELKSVGEVATLQRGYDITENELVAGPYPVISSSGIVGFHNVSTTRGPNVVVGRKGSIGNVHYIETEFWAHDTSLFVTNFFNNYEKYVYYLFVYLKLDRLGTKSGSPSLNRNDIHPVRIGVPNRKEQEEIVDRLSTCTNYLFSLNKDLEKAKQLKKGLMQNLLTGKVCVKPD